MIPYRAAALTTGLLLIATGCAATKRAAVPDLRGDRLDVAEDILDARGLHYRTAGGGALGIVVRSHWVVCDQSPPPHRIASSVLLVVARTCDCTDNEEERWEP